ncbi:hypothetical protein Tco_1578033 [Tanacetum coccineum]
MRTRSQTRNRNHQQQAQPAVVEPFHLEEPVVNPPLVPMADNRTMAQLLQATGGTRFPVAEHVNYAYAFPFSLKFSPDMDRKEPPRSILSWGLLVSNFLISIFPPFKTTNLRYQITRFQQRFDECFMSLGIEFCPFLEHALITYFRITSVRYVLQCLECYDQDSLNSAGVKLFGYGCLVNA